MQTQSNKREDKGKKEWPETLVLKEGESTVLMAVDIRPGVKTRNGVKTVVEVVKRGDPEGKTLTVWWPKDMAVPRKLSPFLYTRLDQYSHAAATCDTQEEEAYLWKEGKVPPGSEKDAPIASRIPAHLKA